MEIEKIKSKERNRQRITLLVVLVVLALIVVNSLLFYTRLDMTKNKEYSISKISQEIVREAPDTIYIDYYISPKLKTATPNPQQVIDILQEYQSRANGAIVFSEKDPSNPENMSVVEENGLQAQQIQVVEENQATYAVVYSGIILSYRDSTRVIPFFINPSTLEYQVTSKIQEMLTDDTRVLGLLVLDEFLLQSQQQLNGLRQIFESDYELRNVASNAPINDDIDMLFVVGVNLIENDTAYYIDQFLMKGRGVYFASDKARVDLRIGLTGEYQDTLIHAMLQSYGVTVNDNIVLDVYNKLIPLDRGGGLRILQNYPMWITITQDKVNKENPLTSRFGGLDLFWTAELTVADDRKDYFSTLISSSDKSWTKSYDERPANPQGEDNEAGPPEKFYQLQPDGSGFLTSKTEENTKSYPVVESFLGPLTSAVESNVISIPEDEDSSNYVKETNSGRFIATGSSAFMWLYQATQASYNVSFLQNAADWLGNDEKLLQIKSRSVKDVRLNKIKDVDKKNAMALLVQLWNMIIIPIIVIAVAIVVLLMRRNITNKKYYSNK